MNQNFTVPSSFGQGANQHAGNQMQPVNPNQQFSPPANSPVLSQQLPPPPPIATVAPQLNEHVNHGTVAVEQSRAIAEALGQIQAAKNFPRSMSQVHDRLADACARYTFAKSATYAYPRGAQTVSGSSIKLAEEIARCYGNITFGIRELSRTKGTSEMQAFAWDLENNVQKTINFTVEHVRDSKKGVTILTDQRDIYEVAANQGSRRVRSCILAVVGRDLEEFALEKCKLTLAGDKTIPIQDRVREMVEKFKRFGVSAAHISRRIGTSLDNILPDHIAELQGIYNSLKDNMSRPSDWFAVSPANEPQEGSAAAKFNSKFTPQQ